MLRSLRDPFVVGTTQVWTTASIGISLFPTDATDTEALLRHADAAMYQAKAGRGGRLAFHQPNGNIVAKRTGVSAQLGRALTGAELELHYLPIWHVGSERGVHGVEALLRWRHPDRGLLRPASFMDLADQSAVADDVIDWVLTEACRHVASWREAGLAPRVSLNMSHNQLLAENFAERFVAVLGEHGLDADRFQIELTESAWTVDPEEMLAVVASLRRSGTSFAIDDFGAGYSSLSRLRERSFDTIKIDRALVAAVPGERTTDAVLRAVVELARACEAELTAQGVERQEQLTFLRDNGISLMQGYLFGQPLPMHEVTPLLHGRLVAARAHRLTGARAVRQPTRLLLASAVLWPSPSRSNPTRARHNAVPSTRSRRRPTTSAPSATARADRIASAPSAAAIAGREVVARADEPNL